MTLIADLSRLSPAEAHPVAGRISLVGAGPGAMDLLTLRAVRRLAEADVVFYDRLVDPEVLALASPQAELRYVGKDVGANAWPQSRISKEITAAAQKGKRVVRLKSGDPSIFGRAAEEIEAARQCDIPIEIVPGITAACAAAASLCRPLTERGRARQVVFASATGQGGDDPCLPARLMPGSSYALYMAVHRLEALVQELLAEGLAPDTTVSVVAASSSRNEQMVECALSSLESDVRRNGLTNPAIIMFTVPAHLRGAATKAQATSAFA
jgi:uroporphyrin-III C-methyltransferase/precorrin-2 dehydrogenase/sirohydrochlorin ferrochelatase